MYFCTMNMRLHLIIYSLLVLLTATTVRAQEKEILSSSIRSVTVMAGEQWTKLPIITLGSGDVVNIAFDDMTHEYHRYTYQLEHCDADWKTSEDLFTNDYMTGTNEDNTIDDVTTSEGTNHLYTHYVLSIPNDRCQPTISGNYRLTVFDDNDNDRPVLRVCFMVSEASAKIGLSMNTCTDIGCNTSYQQLSMGINYGSLAITDWRRQLRVVVLQNGRWDEAVVNPEPQYVKADGLSYDHNRQLIFNGGNVFRKFELLDVTHTSMGVDQMTWDGKEYHAWVVADSPRPNYVYDEAAHGSFLIRNSDNNESDITSEYVLTHLTLLSPHLPGHIYVAGSWTSPRCSDAYEMKWNETKKCYEGSWLLKLGYYSYEYVWVNDQGRKGPVPSEGNYYQTANDYQVLVYYRGNSDRTDRLIATYQTTKP